MNKMYTNNFQSFSTVLLLKMVYKILSLSGSKIFSACDSVTWSQSYIESIFIPRGQSSTIFRISDGLFLSLSNSLSVLALIKLTF